MPKRVFQTRLCGYCDKRQPRKGFRDLRGYAACAECYVQEFAEPIQQLLESKVNVRPDKKPTHEQLERFSNICTELSRRMFGISDGDMDTTVEVKLVDRTREHMSFFQAIPYRHRAETMAEYAEIFRRAQSNLHVANGDFDQAYRMFEMYTLRPLLEAPVTFTASHAATQVCMTCQHGINKPERQTRGDEVAWIHYIGSDLAKERRCSATVFHEAQYQHEQANKAATK